jgi:hypothetical protein
MRPPLRPHGEPLRITGIQIAEVASFRFEEARRSDLENKKPAIGGL